MIMIISKVSIRLKRFVNRSKALGKTLKHLLSTVQASILIGSLLISLSILASGGIMKEKGFNSFTPNPITGSQTNPRPSQPTSPGEKVNIGIGYLPIKGNSSAKVTVVEFADFRCPFCERFFKGASHSIMKDYVDTGKVKYAYRHYAFLGEQSVWAAEASECANEQGKFWEYHDWLYNNQAPESNKEYYSKDNLVKDASNVGVNTNQFASCLNPDKYAKQVEGDLSEGQLAGVKGTPTIFINGTPIVGSQPYATFKALIEQELSK
ncbi:MAG: Thiol:disulfide interchange protein DsbA [Candidatus Curtissbacteria bacterium GW2011_GWC2_41_21]|nr:MAG: Thiol:disulfide interchange protein DsbA [Candidatus Curtissbacteria bacterium GW2011_GWB1_40_28]KKS00651.1 MAG: Thiol:disulfide interchange protein DsbA [Candidatus Curtissbacteria bacterium GW2011_GWC2_41_21]